MYTVRVCKKTKKKKKLEPLPERRVCSWPLVSSLPSPSRHRGGNGTRNFVFLSRHVRSRHRGFAVQTKNNNYACRPVINGGLRRPAERTRERARPSKGTLVSARRRRRRGERNVIRQSALRSRRALGPITWATGSPPPSPLSRGRRSRSLVDRPVPVPSQFMQTSLTFASRFKKKKKKR